jgi:hypothetical protein
MSAVEQPTAVIGAGTLGRRIGYNPMITIMALAHRNAEAAAATPPSAGGVVAAS